MKNWKKFLICSISVFTFLIIEVAVNFACGPEPDPYDYYISFFHNNVQGDDYRNFYLTEYRYLFDDAEPVNEATVNSKEWAAAAGGKLKAADIEQVMYHLDKRADSALMLALKGEKVQMPDSLSKNPFVSFLMNKKHQEFRDYFTHAKDIEEQNSVYDPWDPAPVDTAARLNLLSQSLSKAGNTKNKFLKTRYYYQACKLSLFTGNNDQTIRIYDQYLDKTTDSHVKGWGLALKAGAQRWKKDTITSAYNFSKVFALYPERRVQAYRNYRNTRAKLNDVLRLAQNNEEKSMILGIEGFGDPSLNLSYLENAYQLAPASPVVNILLTRELNKLESYYLTDNLKKKENFYNPYQFIRWDYNNTKAKEEQALHLEKVKAFCLKLAEEKHSQQPKLGYVAAAYLAWMQNRNAEGWSYINRIAKDLPAGRLQDQEKIVRLLLAAQKIHDYNQVNEKELLPALTWLDQKVQEEHASTHSTDYWDGYDGRRFAATARNFYQIILAPAYYEKGDTVSAALAMLKGDPLLEAGSKDPLSWQTREFMRTGIRPNALVKLLALKQRPSADQYGRFLQDRLAAVDPDELKELAGTAFLRQHQFAKAVLYLKQVPAKKRDSLINGYYGEKIATGNPFVDRLADYPLVRDTVHGYGKLRYAQEMAALQQKIKTDPKNAARYYYRMANGFYNSGTFGNSWYLLSYTWTSNDSDPAESHYYSADYIKAKTAREYYQKAMQLSKDPEFRARCVFMLAKCYQKQIPYPEYTSEFFDNYQKYQGLEKEYHRKLRKNPYFAELLNSYPRTRLFAIAQGECSYLRDFLSSYNRPTSGKKGLPGK